MDKLINTEHFKHRLEAAIKSNKEMDYLDFMRICYLLDTEPAAFDKEKVIEDLTDWKNDAEKWASKYDEIGDIDNMDLQDMAARCYKNAIEIVKKGGIE